jgi:hypothetical protein
MRFIGRRFLQGTTVAAPRTREVARSGGKESTNAGTHCQLTRRMGGQIAAFAAVAAQLALSPSSTRGRIQSGFHLGPVGVVAPLVRLGSSLVKDNAHAQAAQDPMDTQGHVNQKDQTNATLNVCLKNGNLVSKIKNVANAPTTRPMV